MRFFILAFVCHALFASPVFAEDNSKLKDKTALEIELTVPEINAEPYHRPYVAVWIETLERDGVITLALWSYQDDDTWLKDLRQWWRKLGRSGEKMDGVSGATRRPDAYQIVWDGRDKNGELLAAGDYFLNIEAAREEGDRTYQRENITLGKSAELTLPANNEIGQITIKVNAQ